MHKIFTLKALRITIFALIVVAVCAGLCVIFFGPDNILVFDRAVMV